MAVMTVEDYKRDRLLACVSRRPPSTKPHSYEIVVNKWVEARAHGYQKDRAKPKAEKRESETVGRAQKPEDHKNQATPRRHDPAH